MSVGVPWEGTMRMGIDRQRAWRRDRAWAIDQNALTVVFERRPPSPSIHTSAWRNQCQGIGFGDQERQTYILLEPSHPEGERGSGQGAQGCRT
jgi:hypothetical protein